jgi:hypothetical protein
MRGMNIICTSRTSQHQLARLTAWTRLMLAWIGAMLFSPHPPRPSRRLIRRRYRLLDLEAMTRMVAQLILIRACAMTPRPRTTTGHARNNTRPGFAMRTRPRGFVRAAIGARLRRRLRHRDRRARLAILTDAIAHLDAYARTLVLRLRRRFTRLYPIVLIRPPHDHVRCTPARAPCPADTS